jgi:hypothetical protein
VQWSSALAGLLTHCESTQSKTATAAAATAHAHCCCKSYTTAQLRLHRNVKEQCLYCTFHTHRLALQQRKRCHNCNKPSQHTHTGRVTLPGAERTHVSLPPCPSYWPARCCGLLLPAAAAVQHYCCCCTVARQPTPALQRGACDCLL